MTQACSELNGPSRARAPSAPPRGSTGHPAWGRHEAKQVHELTC